MWRYLWKICTSTDLATRLSKAVIQKYQHVRTKLCTKISPRSGFHKNKMLQRTQSSTHRGYSHTVRTTEKNKEGGAGCMEREECPQGKLRLQKNVCIMISFEKSKKNNKKSQLTYVQSHGTDINIRSESRQAHHTGGCLWGARESVLNSTLSPSTATFILSQRKYPIF